MRGQSALRWSTEANCLNCDKIGLCATVGRCLTESTGAARITAVARAVDYMIEHVSEPIQLADVARAGTLSPFHFHRIFREITCTTPARFLTTLRMTEAQHLLLNTKKTVTDICTDVGYSSLGTFISQFGRLTGLSPRRYRAVVEQIGGIPIQELTERNIHVAEHGAIGAVTGDRSETYCALLGLFRVNRPREWPSSFQVIETGRVVRTPRVSDGEYEPIAIGFSPTTTVLEVLGAPIGTLGRVGFGVRPLVVRDGQARHAFHVALRRQRRFDPPVEFSRPLLSLARGVGLLDSAARSR